MRRQELKDTIVRAAEAAECSPEETARLAATADHATKIAVGTYLAADCGCPATEAGYHNGIDWVPGVSAAVKRFPHRFDARIDMSKTKLDERGDEYVEVTD